MTLIYTWIFVLFVYMLILIYSSYTATSLIRAPWSRSQARSGPSSLTRSLLHLCSGHSLVMWSAVCLSTLHSHEADGASPIWFMLCFNLSCPVLTRLRCVSKCQLWSCLTGFFDGIGINSISLQGVSSHLLVHAPFVHVVLLFPAASLMMYRACSEKGCRDPGAVVVTMVCSVCWSSASAR